jgi:hypothetical protein
MLKAAESSVTVVCISFLDIRIHMEKNQDKQKAVFVDAEPQNAKLPAPWPEKHSEFQNMLVLQCIRPDKLVLAVQCYVQHKNTLLSELLLWSGLLMNG